MHLFRSIRLLPLGTLLAAAALLSSCGSAGDTVGALLVTDADEVKIGQQFDAQQHADRTVKFYDTTTAPHKRVKAYVDSVVRNVLAQVPQSDRPAYFDDFKISLIDTNIINAFAVPGGFVYIYTGILDTLRDESELAAIIGHELTHVLHHHYRNLLVEQYGISAVVHAVGGDSTALAGIATSLLSLKLSRDHEADADQNGTVLAGAAGYNPLGVADFFQRMPDGALEVLSDHPSNQSRVDAVTAQVKASSSLSALAWTDAAKTVVNTATQYGSRYLAIRGQVH
jgi:predicted Zn-dependent protease